MTEHLTDSRQGTNKQFTLADLLRQSVYSRLAGYEDLNDAVRVSADPTFRLIGSKRNWDRGAALTSTLHGFETEMLASEENLLGLMAVNRELLAQGRDAGTTPSGSFWTWTPPRVRSMANRKAVPTTGTSSQSATTRCCCSTSTVIVWRRSWRPGNVHSAAEWDELLLPEIERQQAEGKQVTSAPMAAFAKPEIYEALEERSVDYAIRIPANKELRVGERTFCFVRRAGLPSSRWCATRAFAIRRRVGRGPEELSPRWNITRANSSRASDLS